MGDFEALRKGFWLDPNFETTQEKLLWVFLITHPLIDMLGTIEWGPKIASRMTGIPVRQMSKILQKFVERDKISFVDGDRKIWIPGKMFSNLGSGNPSKEQVKGFEKLIKKAKFSWKNSQVFIRNLAQVIENKYSFRDPPRTLLLLYCTNTITNKNNIATAIASSDEDKNSNDSKPPKSEPKSEPKKEPSEWSKNLEPITKLLKQHPACRDLDHGKLFSTAGKIVNILDRRADIANYILTERRDDIKTADRDKNGNEILVDITKPSHLIARIQLFWQNTVNKSEITSHCNRLSEAKKDDDDKVGNIFKKLTQGA